jgi:hypothetical protein
MSDNLEENAKNARIIREQILNDPAGRAAYDKKTAEIEEHQSHIQTSAKVIADSIAHGSPRLTTIEVTLHRFVLAEFNTHRIFSRNSASSRAIPVMTQLRRVEDSPAFPISWPCEQPGMQGGNELEGQDRFDAEDLFVDVMMHTTLAIREYLEAHTDKEHCVHKSVINRLLEPFMWHTIVVTSTRWDNFFRLRCSPLAQPEIRAAAELMRDARDASTPVGVKPSGWHLPYITEEEFGFDYLTLYDLQRISVARCARVSSLHAGEARDYEKDFKLFKTLTTADPPHASPLEHVATPSVLTIQIGNLTGWRQLRHIDMEGLAK